MILSRHSGNTLIEYLLLAGPILIVCIAGTLIVGNDLAGYLTALKGDMNQHKLAASTANQKLAAAKTAQQKPGDSAQDNSNVPAADTQADAQNTMESASEWELPGETAYQAPVQTAGGLGDRDISKIHALSNDFDKIAELVKERGGGENEIRFITNLANKGHGRADHLMESWDRWQRAEEKSHIQNIKTLTQDMMAGTHGGGTQMAILDMRDRLAKNENLPPVIAKDPQLRQLLLSKTDEVISVYQASAKKMAEVYDQQNTANPNVKEDTVLIHDDSNDICRSGGKGCIR